MAERGLAAADLTEDAFLGGRVRLRQPVGGPRAGIDPVLLAAAVPARLGQRILDVGTGSGVAACCLAGRVAGVHITGLELLPEMAALARANATLNGLDGEEGTGGTGGADGAGGAGGSSFEVVTGDLSAPLAGLVPGSFDHVMANPPFQAAGHGTAPPGPVKAAAHVEGGATLEAWVAFCLRMARRKGTVTIVHRADRLDALLAALWGRAGQTVVYPLWPRAGVAAKRVVVRSRKDVAGPLVLSPGLVLHHAGSRDFTPEAEAVLRHGEALIP